jgi:hypothetical protein
MPLSRRVDSTCPNCADGERATPRGRYVSGMHEDESPPVRIPEDMDGIHEIAEEGEEDGMTKKQRRNLAEAQAHLRGF